MRLLLDEHYADAIAIQLRTSSYDAVTVSELEIKGVDDESLLTFAAAEERALLTNNVRDFVALAIAWAAGGREHCGLVFTSDESMPRGRSETGRYVVALRALMDANPLRDALRNQIRWLRRDVP